MAKNVRKLQAEIDRSLKQVDEGIQMLNQLENRLEHATSIQMKEKYETDIKKEIKKLQRHRDFFKQLIKDSEIKDKTRMEEARRRIEAQMEKFRELEKEYKSRKLTKEFFQNHNEIESKYRFKNGSDNGGSDSDNQNNYSNSDQGSSNSEENLSHEEEKSCTKSENEGSLNSSLDAQNVKNNENQDDDAQTAASNTDKEWCNIFLVESLRKIASGFELQITQLRQNKNKLSVKKNKDKISQLDTRAASVLNTLQKVYEVQPLLELLDGKRLRRIRNTATQYIRTNGDDEQCHSDFVQEIDHLILQHEQNLLPFQQSQEKQALVTAAQEQVIDERTQMQRDIANHPECITNDQGLSVEELRVGNIFDAQDYLGNWHLAIVIDDDGPANKQLHFLPFKANRDETFKAEEDNCRLAPIFTKTNAPQDKNVRTQFQNLKIYMENFRQKLGKKTEEIKAQTPPAAQKANSQTNQTAPSTVTPQNKAQQPAQAQQPEKTQKRQARASNKQGAQMPSLATGSLASLPFAPGVSGSQNTPQYESRNNNKVREISEDQANQQAHKMMASKEIKNKGQPATNQQITGQGTLSNSLQSKILESSSNLRGLADPTQNSGLTPQAPLFTGNPFAFKGINKPAGLLLQSQLSGPGQQTQIEPQEVMKGGPVQGGLSAMMGSMTNVSKFTKLTAESEGKEIQNIADPTGFLVEQSSSAQPISRALSSQSQSEQQNLQAGAPQNSQSRQQQVLDLLDTSFRNQPEPWDQDVIDPKQPVGVWLKHSYPTVPMYSHAANFPRFDLETLFFAFYYQQETYQQYLAAVELKKETWLFNKRFETWFKKVDSQIGPNPPGQTPGTPGNEMPVFSPGSGQNQQQQQQQQRRREFGKYHFFDYENRWQQRVSGDDIEMDLNQIENELIVQLSDTHPGANQGAQQADRQRQSSSAQSNSMMQGGQPGSAMNFSQQNPTVNPTAARAGQQQQQQ